MTSIAPADIKWFLSSTTSSTGYSGVGTPGSSNGKFMTTSQISTTPLDDLFVNITGPENAAGQVDYQCLFMMNMTATGMSMLNPAIWVPLSTVTPGGCTIALGLDPTGRVLYNQAGVQAVTIASSAATPAGVSFVPASALATQGVLPGNILPNYGVAIWFQRTAVNGAAITGDSFSVQVQFQSNV